MYRVLLFLVLQAHKAKVEAQCPRKTLIIKVIQTLFQHFHFQFQVSTVLNQSMVIGIMAIFFQPTIVFFNYQFLKPLNQQTNIFFEKCSPE